MKFKVKTTTYIKRSYIELRPYIDIYTQVYRTFLNSFLIIKVFYTLLQCGVLYNTVNVTLFLHYGFVLWV